jgi:predicted tellurium resistance membrane protein TerC
MNWILENKEWIFSGVGITFLVIIWKLIKHMLSKKKSSKSKRTINFNGEKGMYIEKNEGEINIQ